MHNLKFTESYDAPMIELIELELEQSVLAESIEKEPFWIDDLP